MAWGNRAEQSPPAASCALRRAADIRCLTHGWRALSVNSRAKRSARSTNNSFGASAMTSPPASRYRPSVSIARFASGRRQQWVSAHGSQRRLIPLGIVTGLPRQRDRAHRARRVARSPAERIRETNVQGDRIVEHRLGDVAVGCQHQRALAFDDAVRAVRQAEPQTPGNGDAELSASSG